VAFLIYMIVKMTMKFIWWFLLVELWLCWGNGGGHSRSYRGPHRSLPCGPTVEAFHELATSVPDLVTDHQR
jgi:hypothetical protein